MLQPISEIMSRFKNFEDSSLVFVLSYHFTWNTYGLHSCEATMFSFTLNFFRFCPCLQWNLQCSAYECFISKHLALIPYWNPVHFPGQFGIKHGGNGTLCFHFRLCHHFHEVWGLHVNGGSVFSIDCKEKKLNTYSTGQYIWTLLFDMWQCLYRLTLTNVYCFCQIFGFVSRLALKRWSFYPFFLVWSNLGGSTVGCVLLICTYKISHILIAC